MPYVKAENHHQMCSLTFYSEEELLNNHTQAQVVALYSEVNITLQQYSNEVRRLRAKLHVARRTQPDDVMIATVNTVRNSDLATAVEWYTKILKFYYGTLEEALSLRKIHNAGNGKTKFLLEDIETQLRKMAEVVYFDIENIVGRRWNAATNSVEYKVKFRGFYSTEYDWLSGNRVDELIYNHPELVGDYNLSHP